MIHVLRLACETPEGERGEFCRWTFSGATIFEAAATAGAFATIDPKMREAIKSPGTRWRLECACRWESRWCTRVVSLWTVAMVHMLASDAL